MSFLPGEKENCSRLGPMRPRKRNEQPPPHCRDLSTENVVGAGEGVAKVCLCRARWGFARVGNDRRREAFVAGTVIVVVVRVVSPSMSDLYVEASVE